VISGRSAPVRALALLAAAALTSCLLAASAAPAVAASDYWVAVCGGGNMAPQLGFWSADQNNLFALPSPPGSSCGIRYPGLGIADSDYGISEPAGTSANWSVSAPPGEQVVGMAVDDASFSTGGGGWQIGWSGSNGAGLTPALDPWLGQPLDCNNGDPGPPCSVGPYNWIWAAQTPVDEVAMNLYCAWSSCAAGGESGYVNQWSVLIQDPYDAADLTLDPAADPTGDALANDANGGWYDGSAITNNSLTVNAVDPGGVCSVDVYMVSAWNTDQFGAGQIFNNFEPVGAPPVGDAGNAGIGGPQLAATSCGATNVTETYQPSGEYRLGSLDSGCYYINATAQNPAQAISGSSSYVLGNALICIDNSQPTAWFSSPANESSWYGTPQQITVDASEPYSGVRDVVCSGGGIGTQTFSSLPATFTVSQVGSDTVTCTPVNNVGTPGTAVYYTVNIDTQTPNVGFGGASPAPAWLTGTPSVGAAGSEAIAASGIGSIDCQAANETTGGQVSAGNGSGASTSVTLDQNGTYQVTCTATTGAGLSGSATEDVQIDNQQPTIAWSGAAPAPAWNAGSPSVNATGTEAVPLSGIATTTCSLDDGPASTGDGLGGDSVQVAGGGRHFIWCYAISGAGVSGPTASEEVQIDDSTPTLSYSDGPSQTTWYRTPQSITVTAADPGGSGVGAIACNIGGTSSTYWDTGDSATETQTITVDPPGGDLVCNAQNGAGTWSGTSAWTFEIDDTPPTGYFLPSDPNNPTVVAVEVADSGPGVQSVTIYLDGNPLPTSWNATSGIAAASVPDNGSISDGTHTLKAIVTDFAGNTATITRSVNLAAASITLPLRVVTNLTAVLTARHQRVAATAQIASARHAATCRLVRIVLRKADPARGSAMSSRLRRSCKPSRQPARTQRSAKKWLSLHFRQTGHVSGRLVTSDGEPVPDAQIVIESVVENGAGLGQEVGTATTDGSGNWRWEIPPGPTRAFTFVYGGTAVLRISSATASVRVAGHELLRLPRAIRAGASIGVSGRIQGGWIPSDGVLVQLWYRVEGQLGGWSPFARVIRTDRQGRWRIKLRISPRARGYTYEFRAVSVQQTNWPYLGAASPTLTRTVAKSAARTG